MEKLRRAKAGRARPASSAHTPRRGHAAKRLTRPII